MMRVFGTLALVFAFSGCGPTVGDPCTTARECGNNICLNAAGQPGGYCTQTCKLDDGRSCPSGTLCVRDGASRDNPSCFRICRSAADCRTGYVCRTEKDSPSPVCIGPAGI